MYSIQVQQISDRPLIDAISEGDFMLIGDVSDGGLVKRVLVSSLTEYFRTQIGVTPTPTTQTLFASSAVPTLDAQNDDNASYELGQQFQVSKNGFVDAIRFYKATGETGTHVGRIWSSTGTLLASVTFAGETGSGWQQQALVTPLAVTANTSYFVSVNINSFYVSTNYSPPVTFSRGDISGSSNGVFGAIGVFPTSSFNNNYFRDIVFRS